MSSHLTLITRCHRRNVAFREELAALTGFETPTLLAVARSALLESAAAEAEALAMAFQIAAVQSAGGEVILLRAAYIQAAHAIDAGLALLFPAGNGEASAGGSRLIREKLAMGALAVLSALPPNYTFRLVRPVRLTPSLDWIACGAAELLHLAATAGKKEAVLWCEKSELWLEDIAHYPRFELEKELLALHSRLRRRAQAALAHGQAQVEKTRQAAGGG
jgi:hypothetical protein